MIKFKRKEFSDIKSSAYKGMVIGASIGTALGSGAPSSMSNTIPGSKTYNSMSSIKTDRDGKTESTSVAQRLTIIGVSSAIGALLGALVGLGKNLNNYISRTSVDSRLMDKIKNKLVNEKLFKEGRDFTGDPKEANILKTKVCMVFSRNAGEFKILVNTVDDPKLNKISDLALKNIPAKTQIKREFAVNRYNEINISTIPNPETNINMTVELISTYIKFGYPVYLVEVG